MKQDLSAFLTERIAEARDILAAVVDVFSGKPHDPTRYAEKPPANWHKATPTAPVPERKSKSLEVDLLIYTPEEILQMSESEYRQKVGLTGVESFEEAQKRAAKNIEKRRK